MDKFEFVSLTPAEGKFVCGGSLMFKYLGAVYETKNEVLYYYDQRLICCLKPAEWEIDNIAWGRLPLNLTDDEKAQFLEMVKKDVAPLVQGCSACEGIPLIPPI